MTKRLFDRYNGLTEYAHLDPMRPDDLVIETIQDDMQCVLDRAKTLSDEPVGKEWRLVACVPNVELHRAILEGWDKDRNAWHKWLNDPDHARFRTWRGRIGKSGQH